MKQKPKVSICLPTLNSLQFLEERVESIRNQSLTDFEVIVFDSYSEDGTWEYLQNVALEDKRFHLKQGPRGLYFGWNQAIKAASGEYLYIATSDDTFDLHFIEDAVRGLEQFPEVDICAFPLDIISGESEVIPQKWESYIQNQYYGDWLKRPHLRDGQMEFLRHGIFFALFHSITALFFRRRIFDNAGYFDETVGYSADVHWTASAVYASDVLYLPSARATWRMHDTQVTQFSIEKQTEEYALFREQMLKKMECALTPFDVLSAERLRFNKYLIGLKKRPYMGRLAHLKYSAPEIARVLLRKQRRPSLYLMNMAIEKIGYDDFKEITML